MKIRLGISPCPNDVYIFAGMILGAVAAPDKNVTFAFDYQDVETLNQRAQSGDFYDVVKISYANYIRCRDRYDLLECGGALGRGVGPLLLRSDTQPFDPDAEVLVPGEFTTANFLLDFYAQRPLRKRFVPFDALYDALRATPGTQGVVIHEKRFTYAADGLTLVRDLGDFWESETGYAIPLGAIAVRRGSDFNVDPLVRASIAWADTHPDETLELCRQHAQDLDESVIRAHIDLYVNDYSRDLGEQGRATVAFFLAQQAGR